MAVLVKELRDASVKVRLRGMNETADLINEAAELFQTLEANAAAEQKRHVGESLYAIRKLLEAEHGQD